jgi:hypothetical protein
LFVWVIAASPLRHKQSWNHTVLHAALCVQWTPPAPSGPVCHGVAPAAESVASESMVPRHNATVETRKNKRLDPPFRPVQVWRNPRETYTQTLGTKYPPISKQSPHETLFAIHTRGALQTPTTHIHVSGSRWYFVCTVFFEICAMQRASNPPFLHRLIYVYVQLRCRRCRLHK